MRIMRFPPLQGMCLVLGPTIAKRYEWTIGNKVVSDPSTNGKCI